MGCPLFDIDGTLQLLNSDHVRERDKALPRSILVGGVWNGFLLGKIRGQDVPCRFCGGRDSDGHLFWEIVLFHLWLRSVNILSFMILLRWIRPLGPGAFFGMVCYPFSLALMVVLLGLRPLLKELLIFLSVLFGWYSSGQLSEWRLPAGFDVEGAARRVTDEPDVWTDGSFVDDKVSGVSSAGACCFTFRVRRLWACWNWVHWDDDVGDGSVVFACRGFLSAPGPLQTVQRAELWGVILALQAGDGIHLGVDNLGVVRHVGRILDGKLPSRPFELLPDGNLLFLIERMLRIRGLGSVPISKVKG